MTLLFQMPVLATKLLCVYFLYQGLEYLFFFFKHINTISFLKIIRLLTFGLYFLSIGLTFLLNLYAIKNNIVGATSILLGLNILFDAWCDRNNNNSYTNIRSFNIGMLLFTLGVFYLLKS
jgi:hypothetical protein